MDIGVFIPIGNNGWLISTASPQYKPSFELNKTVTQKAEKYGLNFALSMIKLRGFGGKSEFWDHNLESFTLMAGLAAVTSKIRLYATVATLTIPPAIIARMASTIDSIAPGRFGINLITGWAKNEYDQMGLWPGDEHFENRYDMLSEYTTVMQQLWATGQSDFKGKYYTMNDCKLSPQPSAPIKLVCAGQSAAGMEFTARFCDYGFVVGSGFNKPAAHAAVSERLTAAAEKTGRDVGSYPLVMVIADETDDLAQAKWQKYVEGADTEALAYLGFEASADKKADETSTARTIAMANSPINFNMGTFVGSYATIARMLDEAAAVPGTKGIMLTFDDFVIGMDQFGQRIQPLMKCRRDVTAVAA
jgi:pyrimidine oxygenase